MTPIDYREGFDAVDFEPQRVGFFERIGCTPGPIGFVLRRQPA
jgi:hypothetical protein